MSSIPPQTVRVLGWNIENYGTRKWEKSGASLIEFIAAVIESKDIHIAAFSELRSGMAEEIGEALVDELGTDWDSFPSKPRGTNRWEEYLFVWNKTLVPNRLIQAAHGPRTQGKFLDMFYSGAGKQVGFRRILADRPPCLAEFALASRSKARLRVAVMHSPNPGFWRDPQDAAVALADVEDLRPNNVRAVLLGDFNVKAGSNAKTGNFGQGAFGDLDKRGFAQLLTNDSPSSLKPRKTKPTTLAQCTSEPYDQIFAWDPPTKSFTNPRVLDLIDDAATDLVIEDKLLALLNKRRTAVAVAFGSIADRFEAYRCMVSDHFPVSVEITL